MFLRILKRDLKRKKTINIIVLLFIILATTFITGSVNSILTVGTGLNAYFDKAGMPDYFIINNDVEEVENEKKILEGIEGVSKVETYESILAGGSNFYKENTKSDDAFDKQTLICPISGTGIKVFNENNKVISFVEKGKILVTEKCVSQGNFKIGDKIIIEFNNVKKEYILSGTFKDAMFGSTSVSINRAIMNDEDYQELSSEVSAKCMLYYITSNNVKKILECTELSQNIAFADSKDIFLACYSLEMVISAFFVIVSICLLIISCIILKFIISSTVNEEFREIGVMKAIGIKNINIRLLYLVKYFVLAFFGGIIGIGLGIPFGSILLETTNRMMAIETKNTFIIGILSAIFVVIIVLLFCFMYTNKIKRLSPIDAVRNVSDQSKTNRKHSIQLRKHIGSSSSFLAINDIARNKRKFSTIVLVYTICLLLTIILTNLTFTINSKSFVTYFNYAEFDVFCSFDTNELKEKNIISEGDTLSQMNQLFDYMKQSIQECGYEGRVGAELNLNSKVMYNNVGIACMSTIGLGTKATDYAYVSGIAPQLKNEIAISTIISQKLGAKIGDTVQIEAPFIKGDFIVTAIYQTMVNMGQSIRFSENAEISLEDVYDNFSVAFGGLINFNDNPSDKEVERRIEVLSNKMCAKKISSHQEFLNEASSIIGTISDVKMVVLILTIVIIALITVLMERSFSLSERTEIALMKAIGFKSKKIYYQHMLRFLFVGLFSILLAFILSIPVTSLSLNPLFSYFGVTEGMNFKIDVFDTFVLNPIIVLGVTCITAFITSLFTRSTKSYDTASIE